MMILCGKVMTLGKYLSFGATNNLQANIGCQKQIHGEINETTIKEIMKQDLGCVKNTHFSMFTKLSRTQLY